MLNYQPGAELEARRESSVTQAEQLGRRKGERRAREKTTFRTEHDLHKDVDRR